MTNEQIAQDMKNLGLVQEVTNKTKYTLAFKTGGTKQANELKAFLTQHSVDFGYDDLCFCYEGESCPLCETVLVYHKHQLTNVIISLRKRKIKNLLDDKTTSNPIVISAERQKKKYTRRFGIVEQPPPKTDPDQMDLF